MLQPITPGRAEAVRQAFSEAERERGLAPILNSARVGALHGVRTLDWGGHRYRVPPVPYRLGIKLQGLLRDLTELKEGELRWEDQQAVLQRILRESVALFRRCIQPVSRWRRLLWPVLPNPFETASEAEVGQLLAYFSMCRTSSRVRSQ